MTCVDEINVILKSSYFMDVSSPSWMSLRRILTKMLSLAASRGSSVPSAEDQLGGTQHQIHQFKWNISCPFPTLSLFFKVCQISSICDVNVELHAGINKRTRLSWALCRRSPPSASRCPRLPPATQKKHVSSLLTAHESDLKRMNGSGCYLVDVLQQIQSLFEVVLVGSPVLIADVQLRRKHRWAEAAAVLFTSSFPHTLQEKVLIVWFFRTFLNHLIT